MILNWTQFKHMCCRISNKTLERAADSDHQRLACSSRKASAPCTGVEVRLCHEMLTYLTVMAQHPSNRERSQVEGTIH